MFEKIKGCILFRFAGQFIYRYKVDDIPSLSAEITYYLILSFFPFLIFLINLLSFTPLSSEMLITDFNAFLPSETGTLVKNIFVQTLQSKSSALLFIGIFGTFWSFSRGILAIIKGLNKAYEVEENRHFIKLNAIAFVSIFGLIFMIILALIMIVFGDTVGTYVLQLGERSLFNIIWSLLRYSIPFAAMYVTFSFLYKYMPNRKLKFRNVMIGTIFTSVGWIITSLLFSFYVNNFANYEKVYGSLGGVIALIIWLNLSTLIILIGGELNAISFHFRTKKETLKKTDS